ncbi:hypothetical protein AB4027_08255 [Alkalibacterium putridalgicola]|uniref:hypothetical protein n=1 Tax=Alkalibacterium putridalgicola TaxID=426703 RepID=UPI0034CECBB2
MYVVLEEIEGETARLVPDSSKEPLYVPVGELPEDYELGDVFLVEKKQDRAAIYLKRDIKEKERRLEVNRCKRKRLLNKSLNKKPDKH